MIWRQYSKVSSLTAISFSQTPASSKQTFQMEEKKKKGFYYYYILNYFVFILNLILGIEN